MQFLLLSTGAAVITMAALAAVPVVIHLINMMRHRRVKWAAMEFLLQSYKRQRNWIFLRQLLLLLVRMAIMVAVLAMLAQLDTSDRWAAMFGGKTTHHYILLDDSYSMSDRAGGTRAFDRANQVNGRIADRAASHQTRQKLTLIRFSQAAPGGDGGTAAQDIDLNAVTIDASVRELLEEKRRGTDVTQLAVGPVAALHLVKRLMTEALDERCVVYVVSDFRTGQWQNPAQIRKVLRAFEAGTEFHLIHCVKSQRPNLGITHLAPADQTRAAGVPLYVVVKVKNHGPTAVQKVAMKVQSVFCDPDKQEIGSAGELQGRREELRTVLIDSIDPGETVSRRVQVYFPEAGQHVIEAILPEDAVAADNHRYCAVDFLEGVPVLIVDDDAYKRNDAYYLSSIFQPGQRARTGIRPVTETSAFLRDTSTEVLQTYHAVYLLDVPRLDPSGVNNLKQFVRAGGGVGIFLGPSSNVQFYNGLYNDENGLFPVPLDREVFLEPAPVENAPDFIAEEHPVFRHLAGEGNTYLRGVTMERYFRAQEDWAPDPQSTTKVLARLRNRRPLVVERKFGDGRVVAFLSTLGPEWNNWARDDSFGLMVLNLQSHLFAPARADTPRTVGSPIDLELDASTFRTDVTFVLPDPGPSGRKQIDKNAARVRENSPVARVSLGRSGHENRRNGETERAGIYEMWALAKKNNDVDVRRFAVNVDPKEGNLTLLGQQQLIAALDPVKFEYHQSDEVQYDLADQPTSNWSDAILVLLICILLGEQVLAYSASYHPARGGVR